MESIVLVEAGVAVEVSEDRFEEMVRRALDDIPDEFLDALDNVAVSVEDEPDPSDLTAVGIDPDGDDGLFGLYVGYPKVEQGHWDVVMPDKISIYRIPICRAFDTEEEVEAEVRKTVFHELGHYFGLSDERLHELGWE